MKAGLADTVCVTKPMNSTWRDAPARASISKVPSAEVMTPFDVPTIITLAPGIGSPFESTTLPLTVMALLCSAGVEILPDEGAPIAVPDSVNAIRADRAVILQIVFPILLNKLVINTRCSMFLRVLSALQIYVGIKTFLTHFANYFIAFYENRDSLFFLLEPSKIMRSGGL